MPDYSDAMSDLQLRFAALLESTLDQGNSIKLPAAVERLLLSPDTEPSLWHRYLDVTGCSEYLAALPGPAERSRWAATAFAAIRASGYSLRTMPAQRLARHADPALFRTLGAEAESWSCSCIGRTVSRTCIASRCTGGPSSPVPMRRA